MILLLGNKRTNFPEPGFPDATVIEEWTLLTIGEKVYDPEWYCLFHDLLEKVGVHAVHYSQPGHTYVSQPTFRVKRLVGNIKIVHIRQRMGWDI